MHPLRLIAAATLALVPLTAHAADVPVVYTVDTTALKLAISGTNLTFQLYTDAACTSLAHTQVLTVDNVSLLSVLKRSKPKNGTKPPKTTDIRAKLTGVAPAAPLYAKVTGTGITPIGGACQVQASTAAAGGGLSGVLVIKDSNGTTMGPFVPPGTFVLDDGGIAVMASAPPSGFFQNVNFLYASTNCSGPPLVFAIPPLGGYLQQMFGVYGTDLYYYPNTGTPTLVNSSDQRPVAPVDCAYPGAVFTPPDICCCTAPTCFATPFSNDFGTANTMDISGFVPPFSVSVQ